MMMTTTTRRQKDFFPVRALGDHSTGQWLVTHQPIRWATLRFVVIVDGLTNRLDDDDGGSSRRARLLRLCSYLQEKYKHMCRQERASIRQKRYRYAFRKALLHAASKNPNCAGQLIQELRGASRGSYRYLLLYLYMRNDQCAVTLM